MSASSKYVFDIATLDASDASRFGGKATGLARMAVAGLPIPPAFVVSTDGFKAFRENGGKLPPGLMDEVLAALGRLETATGKRFAAGPNPLLVSVRSGAAISMPGMMDTVLNLGVDHVTAACLADRMGSIPFVVDTWMRFWRMYSDIVLGLDPSYLGKRVEAIAAEVRNATDTTRFSELETAILSALRDEGELVDASPASLLEKAIEAVFESWDSRRAKAYRKHQGIPDDLGTAVTIQAMVFGNLDDRSGSGVAFTRNPNTGEATLYGEYLTGRQGEDLVAGTHTPIDLSDPLGMPDELHASLLRAGKTLESLYRDAVDIEFTVEAGTLYLLQVRAAKRTGAAAVRIATDAVAEGLIDPADAVRRVTPEQMRKLLRPKFDEASLANAQLLSQGLGSSPGQVHGLAILDADRAAERAAAGEAVILVRPTTSPLDIRGMLAAAGIVTAAGGALSHAAVVSRALDKACVAGCNDIVVEPDARRFVVNGVEYPEGTPISIDGTSGRIYAGIVSTQTAGAQASQLQRLLAFADAASGAVVWQATSLAATPSTLGEGRAHCLLALSDLLVAAGAAEQFARLMVDAGKDGSSQRTTTAISALIEQACAPAFAGLGDSQVHLRLPAAQETFKHQQTSEHSARALLPLGTRDLTNAVLTGIGAAARRSDCRGITVLIDNVSSGRELTHFEEMAKTTSDLSVGAVIRNLVGLRAAADLAQSAKAIWLDVRELTRGAYGLPLEALEDSDTLRAYAAETLDEDPTSVLAPLLANLLPRVDADFADRVGIICNGFSASLLGDLHRRGFRKFATTPGSADEVRLMLAQSVTSHLPS